MILAFLELPIALQAVVLFVERLRDSHIADRMMLPTEFGGQGSGALADPPQRRFRVPPSPTVNQVVECGEQTVIRRQEVLAPRSRATDAPWYSRIS